jgi:hypothetical protein
MDEIISGVSVHNRYVISDILWTFTEIGFQFIVNEHGFVPKGAKVYTLEMTADVSHIKNTYICRDGVYLQGHDKNYDYSDQSNQNTDSDTIIPDEPDVFVSETPESVQELNEEIAAGAVLSI